MNQTQILFYAGTLALCLSCLTTSSIRAQEKLPFDLFAAPIDNRRVYRHFERTATAMLQRQAKNVVEEFQKRLKDAPLTSDITVESLEPFRPAAGDQMYPHMVKSTIYIGELYNCGRCDKTHAGFAGGVIVSGDGLALTNYHVMEARQSGRTEGIYAMTWDGKCWGVEAVLAASKNDDVALVRLKANGHKFYAAPIATTAPDPMDPVRIVSHPFGEFFVMTHGEVSRYSRMRKKRDAKARRLGSWMEVTAPFGSGSSGCAVFNEGGEIVGLVSSIRPLFRNNSGQSGGGEDEQKSSGSRYVEMLIRKCVPLDPIQKCFADGGK